MAYLLTVFFEEHLPKNEAEKMAHLCGAAGLEEVIDLALIEPEMVPAILGADAEALGPTLLKLAERAEKTAEGWARGENMMGGGPPGVGRVRRTLSSGEPWPRSGRPGGTRRTNRLRRPRPVLVQGRREERYHPWADPPGSSVPSRHGP